MRIVELGDTGPYLVKAEDVANGPCAVCRCGLSGKWPLCDGSHKATATEEPGKLYKYERTADGKLDRHEARNQRPGRPAAVPVEGDEAAEHSWPA